MPCGLAAQSPVALLPPTGSDGKFSFKGQLSVYPTGGGVNEVVGMNITIAPTSVITLDDSE